MDDRLHERSGGLSFTGYSGSAGGSVSSAASPLLLALTSFRRFGWAPLLLEKPQLVDRAGRMAIEMKGTIIEVVIEKLGHA